MLVIPSTISFVNILVRYLSTFLVASLSVLWPMLYCPSFFTAYSNLLVARLSFKVFYALSFSSSSMDLFAAEHQPLSAGFVCERCGQFPSYTSIRSRRV